jgi:hypothetical protein
VSIGLNNSNQSGKSFWGVILSDNFHERYAINKVRRKGDEKTNRYQKSNLFKGKGGYI